ncbi:Druantia anti-phage system protein DruA [Acidiferrobacter sp. SPIII_3]|uniref:Druantia anti-phage system protein DruA n=1 Tax=Acidiferrobacter sp. SPIII_3 TaxID=1281578 RepID=UPI00143D4949|nr:Druantia anti-phage system protein DruA [Acidiferrobacter sp. SPIII_3]
MRVQTLPGHVLALRTVTADWTAAYGVPSPLAENLVDPARLTDRSAGNAGHCYRVAHWIDVGLTAGRGRAGRHHLRHEVRPKRILLYPPAPNARHRPQQAPEIDRHDVPTRHSEGASLHIENSCEALVRSLAAHGNQR